MGDYRCWGDDGEDLTNQVRMKVLIEGTDTLRTARSDVIGLVAFDSAEDAGHWRVTGIRCSKGHENSFEGYGAP